MTPPDQLLLHPTDPNAHPRLASLHAKLVHLYHSEPELDQFPQHALDLLQEATASDLAVYGEVDHTTWQNRGLCTDQSPEVLAALGLYASTPRGHAFFEAHPSFYDGRMLFAADCMTPEELADNAIYKAVYAPIGVRHILSFNFAFGSKVIVFGAMRRIDEPFAEADRDVAVVLRGSFEKLYGNASANAARNMSLRERLQLVFPALTPRQLDVAVWLAMGKSNPVIAQLLGVSQAGVKFHLRSIFNHIGAEDRTTAALILSQAAPQFVPSAGARPRNDAMPPPLVCQEE